MRENGEMICGMAKEHIHLSPRMLSLKENGKMEHCMELFKLSIKMDKDLLESMLAIKKMVKEWFNIKMELYSKGFLKTTKPMAMGK
jgi:hypothetical protein